MAKTEQTEFLYGGKDISPDADKALVKYHDKNGVYFPAIASQVYTNEDGKKIAASLHVFRDQPSAVYFHVVEYDDSAKPKDHTWK